MSLLAGADLLVGFLISCLGFSLPDVFSLPVEGLFS